VHFKGIDNRWVDSRTIIFYTIIRILFNPLSTQIDFINMIFDTNQLK